MQTRLAENVSATSTKNKCKRNDTDLRLLHLRIYKRWTETKNEEGLTFRSTQSWDYNAFIKNLNWYNFSPCGKTYGMYKDKNTQTLCQKTKRKTMTDNELLTINTTCEWFIDDNYFDRCRNAARGHNDKRPLKKTNTADWHCRWRDRKSPPTDPKLRQIPTRFTSTTSV